MGVYNYCLLIKILKNKSKGIHAIKVPSLGKKEEWETFPFAGKYLCPCVLPSSRHVYYTLCRRVAWRLRSYILPVSTCLLLVSQTPGRRGLSLVAQQDTKNDCYQGSPRHWEEWPLGKQRKLGKGFALSWNVDLEFWGMFQSFIASKIPAAI